MPEQPLNLQYFPTAIVHVDGDAFFASVEQALHPYLKNKPIVTGQERGIIACASYEAKLLGINRGLSLWEAQKQCPELIVLPNDYESYSLYSKRMFDILRNYTPIVEESSIDEGFADISGMQRVFRMSYENIARAMQKEIQEKLDISVSIGLSTSKLLAKLAADFRKPGGITVVAGIEIHKFLPQRSLGAVCGFGRKTVQLLEKYGLYTAYDFVMKPEKWAEKLLGKPGKEIWNELRGKMVYKLNTEKEPNKTSISKAKSFTSPIGNRDYVYARLIRNLECTFIKLRRHNLMCREIYIALRTKDFRQYALGARLNRASSNAAEAVPVVQEMFLNLFRPGTLYRFVLVVLAGLSSNKSMQPELFEDRLQIERTMRLSEAIDKINKLHGKHKICFGTSLFLNNNKKTKRDELPWRKQTLLKGESFRKRLHFPRAEITRGSKGI